MSDHKITFAGTANTRKALAAALALYLHPHAPHCSRCAAMRCVGVKVKRQCSCQSFSSISCTCERYLVVAHSKALLAALAVYVHPQGPHVSAQAVWQSCAW